jgi:hypothetical protein
MHSSRFRLRERERHFDRVSSKKNATYDAIENREENTGTSQIARKLSEDSTEENHHHDDRHFRRTHDETQHTGDRRRKIRCLPNSHQTPPLDKFGVYFECISDGQTGAL